jgi:hypothetical protein
MVNTRNNQCNGQASNSQTNNTNNNPQMEPQLRLSGFIKLLMDLSMVEKPIRAILMNCDNETMITKVNSSNNNRKSSRHVKRQLKYVRKLRLFGVIALDYIPTTENLAEQFTKGLS